MTHCRMENCASECLNWHLESLRKQFLKIYCACDEFFGVWEMGMRAVSRWNLKF